MKRGLSVLAGLSLSLVLAACGGPNVEIIASDELPPDIYGRGASEPERSTDLVLYMVEGNRLVRVARTGRAAGTPAEVAVRGLLEGPTGDEIGEGIETKMHAATELLGITVDNGVAQVNMNDYFQVVADPSDVQEYILRMAQLVWTLDEIPEVSSVRLLVNGEPQVVYDQFKRRVSTPVARGRYSRFEPRSGRPVSESPIQID